MRLSKFIAHSGFCSRREAEQLISSKKVIINKEICEDFSYKVRGEDEAFIGKKKIDEATKLHNEGMKAHKGGDHAKSEELLNKALNMFKG